MHYYLPRSASWIEEMEKRSRRRTRDLVALAASQGLSQNEIGCARISMMARSTNAPCKGRKLARGGNDKERAMSQTPKTVGIDIGKTSFHVVGHDERGAIVLRQN